MKTFSIEYTAKNLTKNAGLVNLGKFADKIGLPGILDRRLTIKRGVQVSRYAADFNNVLYIIIKPHRHP